MSALVAVDAGGSYVKATLFDTETGASRTVGEPMRVAQPAPGRNERDPEELWQAVARCIAAVAPRGGVAAIGLTGHGNGVYLVDEAGMPTRRAVMAADGRAASKVRRWLADGAEEALRPHGWNGLWAGQPGPILSVLAEEEPDVLKASAALLSCKDYLAARLTGDVRTEISDAVAGALYDNAVLVGDPSATPPVGAEALRWFGIEQYAGLLHAPVPSLTVGEVSAAAAEVTGLAVGTPVVAGVVDNIAVQHGSGVFGPTHVCIGAGTWSLNQVLVPTSDMTADGALGRVRPFASGLGLGSRTGLLCEASATSASAFAWALERGVTATADNDRTDGRDPFAARLEREADRPLRMGDPIFLPYLDGSRDDAGARAAWIGLSSSTDEATLLGAVVEGICLEHRRHVERLELALAESLPIRISGGATKSAVWCQRFADVLGRVVERSPIPELGSVCAAAIAGSVAGVFDDVEAGVDSLNPTWEAFDADPERAAFFDARYQRYAALAAQFDRMPWE